MAIVTGATGAIGEGIADALLAEGARLCLVGRTRERLDRLIEARRWDGERVDCEPVDLGVESAVAAFASTCARRYRSVDVLVHCAGTIALAPVQEASLADLDAQYRVNVRAPYQLTQALLPSIIAAGGQIVFVNSTAGRNARQHTSQYAATKHALRAIADSLRDEVNPSGVRVLSVFVGRTASAMQAAVHAHERRPYRPEVLLQPSDVAAVVLNSLALPRTAEVTDIAIRPLVKSY